MKRLILALLLALPGTARAVSIEGVTPTGYMRTVGVSEDGKLSITGSVEVSTAAGTTFSVQGVGGTPTPVVVSFPGAMQTAQGTNPWVVSQSTHSVPWQVTTAPGIATEVKVSTFAATLHNQVSVSPGGPVALLPADTATRGGCVFNVADPEVCDCNLWVGGAAVTTGNGILIKAGGGGYCPPEGFVGALYGASTATLTGAYIYHK